MKKLTRKELTNRLDRLRQTCARYDGAKKKGGVWVNRCVTCGRVYPCNKIQGGHLISRICLPLRWDEKNVSPQCVGCNIFRNGAYIEYVHWFIEQYGGDVFDQYVEKYREWKTGKIPPASIQELRDIYNHWLKEGRALENKVGPLFPKSWAPEIDFLE